MKFTNERISNADREKYQTMGIDFGIAEDWATGNYREEPDFPPYKFNDWLYFYKGKVMEFSSCIYLRNDRKHKIRKDTFILRYIISSSIPDDEIDDSFFMLKEALKVHGKYGFPDKTRLTDFIFEF